MSAVGALIIEDFLRPRRMRCARCDAMGIAYPSTRGGDFACPSCTPDWMHAMFLDKLQWERAEFECDPVALADETLPDGLTMADLGYRPVLGPPVPKKRRARKQVAQ